LRRQITLAAIAVIAALAMASAAFARAGASAASQTLSVLGPYTGADQQSFQAVLSGFEKANPGMNVTFASAGGDVAAKLSAAATAGTQPDVAVLRLPQDLGLMQSLAAAKSLQRIGFVAPALDQNYAFTWKPLGVVDGGLYGLPFKVDDESAFWYNPAVFSRAGVQAPTTWTGLERVARTLTQKGIKPFAIAGGDGASLPEIFANVYLTQQGPKRYDALAAHAIKWTDPKVAAALREMASIVQPEYLSTTPKNMISSGFTSTMLRLFRNPSKAAMLFGGSDVFSVLDTKAAVAARPASEFGAFAFPRMAAPPTRVVGGADVIVMLKDSPAARSLIDYLATPAAATIWAKRGGFLSPNRGVPINAYPLAASRAMATQVTETQIFRLDLAGLEPAGFQSKLAGLLGAYVRSPARIAKITQAIEAARLGA
jgi:alpha-glucoside transport system substrate-binding protein